MGEWQWSSQVSLTKLDSAPIDYSLMVPTAGEAAWQIRKSRYTSDCVTGLNRRPDVSRDETLRNRINVARLFEFTGLLDT